VARIPQVADTNVCVVANRPDGASLQCVSKCAKALRDIVAGGILVLDDDGAVFAEYRRYLSLHRQLGMGHLFFKWLIDNRYRPDRVVQVSLAPHAVNRGEYADFPEDPTLEGFDRDDRVFVALSRAHPQRPPILNAVDSDYWHYDEELTRNGVIVIHVCGTAHYKPRLA